MSKLTDTSIPNTTLFRSLKAGQRVGANHLKEKENPYTMQLATWNVNSLNVRLPHVLEWLHTHRVDALCLQELKQPDDQFPFDAFQALGYQARRAGQKTYKRVGILKDGRASRRESVG